MQQQDQHELVMIKICLSVAYWCDQDLTRFSCANCFHTLAGQTQWHFVALHAASNLQPTCSLDSLSFVAVAAD